MTATFLAGLGGGVLLALAYGMGRAAARPYPACPCLDEPIDLWPDDPVSAAADREAEIDALKAAMAMPAYTRPYDWKREGL